MLVCVRVCVRARACACAYTPARLGGWGVALSCLSQGKQLSWPLGCTDATQPVFEVRKLHPHRIHHPIHHRITLNIYKSSHQLPLEC